MNLRGLISLNPGLFMPQTWYAHEAFMDIHARPARKGFQVSPPNTDAPLVHAVALAQRYVEDPTAFVWRRYLWTADVDDLGQRVYLGSNGRGLEIHRHLDITSRWGIPTWHR